MEATQRPWQAAFAVLLIVLVFWLVATLVTALLRVPHSRDAARRCFAWLKLALFSMTVAVVLLVTGSLPAGLGTAFGLTIGDSLGESLHQCRTVGYLLYQVAFVFALPMLLDAALAVLYDWELIESPFPPAQTAAYAFVVVEIVFAVVIFIFVEINNLDYATLNSSQPGGVLPYLRLLTAFDVFLWMASVGMTLYLVFLVSLARRRPTHQKATRLLCAASAFWLTRNSWGIAADATWVLSGKSRPGTYDAVLEAIFSYWAQFGCLGLLCLLGQKRTAGLWTSPAPRYHAYTRSPYLDPLTRPMVAFAGPPSEPYDGLGPPVYPGRAQTATTTATILGGPSRLGSSLASPVWPLPPLLELHSPGGSKGGAPPPSTSVRVSDDMQSRSGHSACRSPSQSSLLEAYRTTASQRAPSTARSVDSAPRSNLRRHQSLDRFLEQNRLGVSLANELYSAPKRL